MRTGKPDGALVRDAQMTALGAQGFELGDIATSQDALALESSGDADVIITNPLRAPAYERPDRTSRAAYRRVSSPSPSTDK